MKTVEFYDPEALPHGAVRAGFYLFCAVTAFVILALSPYTYQLDDIKIPGLFIGGAAMLAYWAGLWYFRLVPTPPRVVWISYALFVVFGVVSTLVSDPYARWSGWQYTAYYIASFGFVLLGYSVVQTRKMVELSLKFWVLLTLATTLFGLVHYFGLLESFYNMLYPHGPPADAGRFHALLYTFKNARSMLSTILNVQFFGNFLLMVLPVTLSCAVMVFRNLQRRMMEEESVVRPVVWTVLNGLALVFSVTCIFTTFSKSSIIFLPAVLVAFLAGVVLFARVRRIPYMGVMAVAGIIMAGTVLYFTAGDLRNQLASVEESAAPRRMIFAGAWNMFLDNFLLGGGPGTFRIYFPTYRSPDYHLTRVSNVTTYAHNWLLDLLAENGFLGTLSFLIFLGGIVWLGYLGLRRCPDLTLRVAIVGCLIGVGGLLAGSSLTPMSRWPVGTVALHAMLGTALGVAMMALRPVDGSNDAPEAEGAAALPPWQGHARGGFALFAVAFFVYHAQTQATAFRAAFLHNEGLSRTDLPASALPEGFQKDERIMGSLRKGISLLEESIRLDPTRTTTYYKLAHAYNRVGLTDKALETYLRLQQFNPDYSEVHFNLGVIYYNMLLDFWREREALRKDPTKADQLKTVQGKIRETFEKCRAEFAIANRMSNKISIGYFRANALFVYAERMAETPEEAKAIYREAGEIYATVGTRPVATVLQEENQQAVEQEQRDRSLQLAPECFARAGDFVAAGDAAAKYLDQAPNTPGLMQSALDWYRKGGKPEAALALLDRHLASNPISPDLHLLRFTTLRSMERSVEAAEQGRFVLHLHKSLKEQGLAFLTDGQVFSLKTQLKELPEKKQDPS